MNESPKVVDASLAVKWLVDEEDSDKARALSRSWANSGVKIAAPYLMLAEVANALHRKVVDGEMELPSATRALENLGDPEIEFQNPPNIHVGALRLADQLNQGAVYDSIYLALAERLDCELWTADRSFTAPRGASPTGSAGWEISPPRPKPPLSFAPTPLAPPAFAQ